jgi:hypothetical protein
MHGVIFTLPSYPLPWSLRFSPSFPSNTQSIWLDPPIAKPQALFLLTNKKGQVRDLSLLSNYLLSALTRTGS